MEDRQLTHPESRASWLLGLAGALAALSPSAAAEPVDRNEHHRQVVLHFTEQDGDGDGLLQSVEATDLAPERFESADRDRDGRLTLVEYVDARFEEIAAPAGAPAEEPAEAPPAASATPEAQAEAPPPPGP